ncbi:hypothetical protein BGX21_004610 [Mortierella sp. AD011]|nr:hypothetical protein BGX20_007282 [Mortierella sp. AD010]KAF9400288.1 hypothetical protein BGX21_004610 [Mortierella sp. AD011]
MGTFVCSKLYDDYLGLVHDLDVRHVHESHIVDMVIQAMEEPVVFLPIQEIAKARDQKECARAQKLAKLEFNTKLGMHSPL